MFTASRVISWCHLQVETLTCAPTGNVMNSIVKHAKQLLQGTLEFQCLLLNRCRVKNIITNFSEARSGKLFRGFRGTA